MNNNDLEKMSNDLRTAVQAYRNRNARFLTPASPELYERIEKDCTRLNLIADLIRDGKVITAGSWAFSLESVVRNEIPAHVWVFLGGTLVNFERRKK